MAMTARRRRALQTARHHLQPFLQRQRSRQCRARLGKLATSDSRRAAASDGEPTRSWLWYSHKSLSAAGDAQDRPRQQMAFPDRWRHAIRVPTGRPTHATAQAESGRLQSKPNVQSALLEAGRALAPANGRPRPPCARRAALAAGSSERSARSIDVSLLGGCAIARSQRGQRREQFGLLQPMQRCTTREARVRHARPSQHCRLSSLRPPRLRPRVRSHRG